MALKPEDRREFESSFLQLGVEEGKGLNKICFAPLVAAGDDAMLENCTVQSVWGYLKNERDFPHDYIETMMKCIK
jgi:Niemann-Pick C1 protein